MWYRIFAKKNVMPCKENNYACGLFERIDYKEHLSSESEKIQLINYLQDKRFSLIIITPKNSKMDKKWAVGELIF